MLNPVTYSNSDKNISFISIVNMTSVYIMPITRCEYICSKSQSFPNWQVSIIQIWSHWSTPSFVSWFKPNGMYRTYLGLLPGLHLSGQWPLVWTWLLLCRSSGSGELTLLVPALTIQHIMPCMNSTEPLEIYMLLGQMEEEAWPDPRPFPLVSK